MPHVLHRQRVEVAECDPGHEEKADRPEEERGKARTARQSDCPQHQRRRHHLHCIGRAHDPPHAKPHHKARVQDGASTRKQRHQREPARKGVGDVVNFGKDLLR